MRYDQFENYLDTDLAWRKKEISELLLLAKTSNKEVLLKSLILLLYAHWEGYIKKSSKLYIKYVSEEKIKINDLSSNFTAIVLKSQISRCIEESDSLTLANELSFINGYLKKINKRFKIKIDPDKDLDKDIIDTQSNLKPKVFKSIVDIVGLDYKTSIETREHYINSNLLANRNCIGHGSPFDHTNQLDFSLTLKDIEKLKDIIFSIIDNYREELLDYVNNEFYLSVNEVKRKSYTLKKDKELEKLFSQIESV
ncbi:MAE_28990/MAE_18760 family HEPN-like nuclease [Aquimarina hainanensis]|uniref:MAE_28990/MAE_18760 family HEPN-like nuclease n=1 Tax=Aquimarina hainanensis TaxID=1578017 RepID=A0ABW5ND17_9FLAO